MNRRRFLHTFVGIPIFTPLLLASKRSAQNCELYLISDHPHIYIYPLLETLQDSIGSHPKTFTVPDSHPCQEDLTQILIQKGWAPAEDSASSDLTISSSHLTRKACPSFSLVKNGRIWDIRSWKLNTLWQSMTKTTSPSSLVTVAAFSDQSYPLEDGHSVALFKDGSPIEHLPLKRNVTRRIPARQGPITVRVHEGRAWIARSPCRNKICISAPPISKAGQRIICAPNHFLLEIQGRGIDTVIG